MVLFDYQIVFLFDGQIEYLILSTYDLTNTVAASYLLFQFMNEPKIGRRLRPFFRFVSAKGNSNGSGLKLFLGRYCRPVGLRSEGYRGIPKTITKESLANEPKQQRVSLSASLPNPPARRRCSVEPPDLHFYASSLAISRPKNSGSCLS